MFEEWRRKSLKEVYTEHTEECTLHSVNILSTFTITQFKRGGESGVRKSFTHSLSLRFSLKFSLYIFLSILNSLTFLYFIISLSFLSIE